MSKSGPPSSITPEIARLMDIEHLGILLIVAVVAGFVDAIAGGGGLLTVPALALSGLDPVSALATNKLQSAFGSGAATLRFWRAGHLDLSMWPIALAAGLASVFGTLIVTYLPKQTLSLGLPVLLVAVAIYFAVSPKISDHDQHPRMTAAMFIATFVPFIGFYDGAFGPGTGSFFMAGFVGLLGLGVVKAAARTKLANFASNLGSLATFILGGHVVWLAGFVMGAGQFLGAWLGAHVAMNRGAKLVKPLIIAMSLGMAARLVFAPTGLWHYFFAN